jgi:hypothetical protein
MGVAGLILRIHTAIREQRRRTAACFRGPSDGLRLLALGAILVNLAALALTGPILGSRLASYAPGYPAIFGGAMLCNIILRISRPAV